MEEVSVIGAGYVGLVTAVGLATLGHDVISMDKDEDKISKLKSGEIPFYDEGLEDYMKRVVEEGRLEFTTDMREAVSRARYIFIAVNTPMDEDGSADLGQLLDVSRSLADQLDHYAVVVVRSTAPVGSLEVMAHVLEERGLKMGRDFSLAYNPEFLREGKGIYDFLNPTRIVVGADDRDVAKEVMRLYEGLDCPKITTDVRNAQLIKYASNAFLAMRVSFINEIATICETLGGDVSVVAEGMGYDPRIGRDYLKPGPGYGGPCLPKDLLALIRMSEENGYYPALLDAIRLKNESQMRRVIWRLKQISGGVLIGRTIGVLGLTFKPGTDDVRNSTAVSIANKLVKLGAVVKAYDPMGNRNAEDLLPHVEISGSPEGVFKGADVILILTAWPEFRDLNWGELLSLVENPFVFDTVGILRGISLKGWRVWFLGTGGNP